MNIELHIIQNFAPSNLNRDDNNAPKECEFGGRRRARVSSQALKRAIRVLFSSGGLPKENQAVRTKKVQDEVVGYLVKMGRPAAEAAKVAFTLLAEVFGMKEGKENEADKSDALVFIGHDELAGLAAICNQHWDVLSTLAGVETDGEGKKGKGGKGGKKELPKEALNAVNDCLDGHRAIDLALFGRFIAKRPENNVDAACQVAHAISTHAVNTEFDFFTAVDDLARPGEAVSAMLGMTQFNSPCMYRYSSLDLRQLAENLQGDAELVKLAAESYIRTAIAAIPSAKQATMATPTMPSMVMVVVRDSGNWSLANAFVKPVRPDEQHDLVQRSVMALDDYWGRLSAMYGDDQIKHVGVAVLEDAPLKNLGVYQAKSVSDIVKNAVTAALGAK